jgi:hypothetical protein
LESETFQSAFLEAHAIKRADKSGSIIFICFRLPD